MRSSEAEARAGQARRGAHIGAVVRGVLDVEVDLHARNARHFKGTRIVENVSDDCARRDEVGGEAGRAFGHSV